MLQCAAGISCDSHEGAHAFPYRPPPVRSPLARRRLCSIFALPVIMTGRHVAMMIIITTSPRRRFLLYTRARASVAACFKMRFDTTTYSRHLVLSRFPATAAMPNFLAGFQLRPLDFQSPLRKLRSRDDAAARPRPVYWLHRTICDGRRCPTLALHARAYSPALSRRLWRLRHAEAHELLITATAELYFYRTLSATTRLFAPAPSHAMPSTGARR